MRPQFALALALACLPACRHAIRVPVPPPGLQWTVRTIEFSGLPDGTAAQAVALWQERRVPFEVGRPYAVPVAQAAMKSLADYCRKEKLSRKTPSLTVKKIEGENVTFSIR